MLAKAVQTTNRDTFISRANNIIKKPSERISEPLKSIIFNNTDLFKKDKAFFDVHAHSFTIDHIPKDFIKILNWVSNRDRAKILEWIDKRFGLLLGLDSPQKIIDALISIYDKFFEDQSINPHLFIVNLTMDMERGISGAPTFNFKKQIQQILKFHKNTSAPMQSGKRYKYNTTILPFLAIDPNNPDAFEYFLSAFIKNYNSTGIAELDNSAPFIGIKLYPSLGYSPLDPVLLDIYKICEEKSIPITTHCGGIRTRTNRRNIEIGSRRIENGHIVDSKKIVKIHSKENIQNIFLDPLHWVKVLTDHPNLKLNLAHFGSQEEWNKFHSNRMDPKNMVFKTLKLIEDFDNVYADISYSFYDGKNRSAIAAMMQMDKYKTKILMGSDFFLTEIEKSTTKAYLEDLVKDFKLIQDSYHLLTSKNPYNFLFG